MPRLIVLSGPWLNKVVTGTLFQEHYHLRTVEREALSPKQDVLLSGPISYGLSFVSVCLSEDTGANP